MRHLHFDIISGIAGDMTMGALIHLGAPLEPLQRAMQAMGLRQHTVSAQETQRNGIQAIRFLVSGPEEDHAHRSLDDILRLLRGIELPKAARDRAEAIFHRLAEAEAKVHGGLKEQVLFHEVGAVDSIADILGCALALEFLSPHRITSSYPLTGTGVTQSRHGPIPIPAPATVELLKNIRLRALDIEAELTTPTGAAILASQVQSFTNTPEMTVTAIGYGAGTREIPGRPNLLRVLVGEGAPGGEEEWRIEANLDDMNPAFFEHLMDRLFSAGALDVWLQPVIMKKSRPAVVLCLLCGQSQTTSLEEIIFAESTTIGVRRQPVSRRKLHRVIRRFRTPYGSVRMKIASEAGHIFSAAPEYEDCRLRAEEHRVPLKQVYQAAQAAYSQGSEDVQDDREDQPANS